MVMVPTRAFAVGILGMIMAVVFAAVAQKFSPSEHLLVLQGHDASHLVVYCSAFLGAGFGAVIGAISAATELVIAAAARHGQSGEVQPAARPPAGRPG